ncbi:F/Y rich C-terminus-domain-containing protein [Pilobolus umbonatus]|nr:F/Y rich C-terminus-domain-containing protein [Pilobolus umbonatus]
MDMDVAQGGSEKDDQMDEDGDDMDEEDDEEDEASVVYVPPKRVRASRKRRLSIPRDENGVVQLPFQIASLTILSLGKIDYERPLFHNERYIWPIGYTAEKTFMSMLNPVNQTVYTCRVEDGQDGPLFTLQAADAPDIELSAKTATGVWALVIKKANEARKKESSNAISGPEYYGFAHPLVCEMIEEMDGVDQCTRYVRRT